MKTNRYIMTPEALKYLDGNPVVKKFIDELNDTIRKYYEEKLPNLTFEPVTITIGTKFIGIDHNGNRWGFISRVDDQHMGHPLKKGDLLKPMTYKSPAKHSRGNIGDGTARYGVYGPEYIR